MRRLLVDCWFRLALCLAAGLLAGGTSWAADKDVEHGPKKYRATLHQDGKEVEKEFDMGKEKDTADLAEALRKGEVGELTVSKTPDIFGLSVDLGLWTLVVFLLLLYILRKAAWKPMLEGLQRREEGLHGDIATAR